MVRVDVLVGIQRRTIITEQPHGDELPARIPTAPTSTHYPTPAQLPPDAERTVEAEVRAKVAAETSLSEVATSVLATIGGECDIAVGNIIGSCPFNLLAVRGLDGLVAPGHPVR